MPIGRFWHWGMPGKFDVMAGSNMETEDSPVPEVLYPEWQNEYEAALLEFDHEKLAECIEVAETAIYKRLQQIFTERQVIEDALGGLRVLKRDVLGFPDWERK